MQLVWEQRFETKPPKKKDRDVFIPGSKGPGLGVWREGGGRLRILLTSCFMLFGFLVFFFACYLCRAGSPASSDFVNPIGSFAFISKVQGCLLTA